MIILGQTFKILFLIIIVLCSGCDLYFPNHNENEYSTCISPYIYGFTSLNNHTIKLDWSKGSGNKHRVERADSTNAFQEIATELDTTYFVDTGIDSTKWYQYRVQSYGGLEYTGRSFTDYSNVIRIFYGSSNLLLHSHQEAGINPVFTPTVFTPDGNRIATASGIFKVWRLPDWNKSFEFESTNTNSLTVTSDGNKFILGNYTDITIYDAYSGNLLQTIDVRLDEPSSYNRVDFLRTTQDGSILVSGHFLRQLNTTKNVIKLWQLPSGTLLKTFDAGWAETYAVSPNDKYIVTFSRRESSIWRISDLSLIKKMTFQYPNDSSGATCIAFSPDGQYLAGCNNNRIVLWETTNWSISRVIYFNSDWISNIAFSPDGNTFFMTTISYTNVNAYLVRVSDWQIIRILDGIYGPIYVSPNNQSFVIIKFSTVTHWSMNSLTYRWQLKPN